MGSKPRADLSDLLKNQIGVQNLYFQPPSTVKMKYPCIRYKLDDIDAIHADNRVYDIHKRYELMLIDPDPDSEFVDKLAMLPRCRFVRYYTADNLNHYVYEIYY